MDFVLFYLGVAALLWFVRGSNQPTDGTRADFLVRHGVQEFVKCLGWPLILLNYKEKDK